MWYRPNTVSRPAFWPPVDARQQLVTLRRMLFRIIVPVIIHSRLAPVLVLILDLVMLEIVEAALTVEMEVETLEASKFPMEQRRIRRQIRTVL